jgi:TRAP-type C4-dicarboxylate transport system substrate-binding protein
VLNTYAAETGLRIDYGRELGVDLKMIQAAAARIRASLEAADAAAESGRQKQLAKEEELVSFLQEKGLDIYEPDLAAFRSHVQAQYVGSEFAKAWPEGVLEKINALGN